MSKKQLKEWLMGLQHLDRIADITYQDILPSIVDQKRRNDE